MAIEGFALRKGDTYNWKLTFDDGAATPAPIDITGKTLTFTVKASLDDLDADALIQVSTTFPATADSIAGIGYIFIPHTQTTNLTPLQKVYYDFQLSFIDDDLRENSNTLTAGTVKADWEVTLTP